MLALARRTKHRELTCNKVSWETPSTLMDLLPRLRNTRFIAHSATTTSFDDASQMLLLMTAIRPGNDGVIRRISSRSQCSCLIADQLVKLQALVRSVTACSFKRSDDTERCSFYFTGERADVSTWNQIRQEIFDSKTRGRFDRSPRWRSARHRSVDRN